MGNFTRSRTAWRIAASDRNLAPASAYKSHPRGDARCTTLARRGHDASKLRSKFREQIPCVAPRALVRPSRSNSC